MKLWEKKTHPQIAWKRSLRRLKSKEKQRARRYHSLLRHCPELTLNKGFLHIHAPEAICIYKDTYAKHTLKFLGHVRKYACSGYDLKLRFDKTKLVSAAAMLLLLSTVDRLKRKGKSLIVANYPQFEKTESIFNQTGFTRLLGKNSRSTPDYDDVNYWDNATGTTANPVLAENLFNKIEDAIPNSRKLLFRGFIEGISNSVEHGYKHLSSSYHSRFSRWWAFGGIKSDTLTLLICDLGAGIPKTLPREIDSSWLTRALNKIGVKTHHDAELIQAATYLRETATKKQHRGKGLHDIKMAVEKTPGSSLHIVSNRGAYSLHNTKRSNIAVKLKRYTTSIRGTIIEWQMPLGDIDEIETN